MRNSFPHLFLFITSIAFISSVACAQPFFSTKPAAPVARPGTHPVMSADDFKNAVKTLGKQNQQKLSQEAATQMPKAGPKAITPTAAEPATSGSVMAAPTEKPAGTTPPSAGSTGAGNTYKAPESPAPSTEYGSSSGSGVATGATPASGGNQGSVYTGFGGGTSAPATNQTTQPAGNTGGWNIKY